MDKKTAVYDRLKINNDQNLTIPETASLFCSGGAVFRKGVAIGDNDSIIPGTLRYNDNTLQVRKFEDWKTITTQQGTGGYGSIATFNEDGEIQGSNIKIENNQLLHVEDILPPDSGRVNIPRVNVEEKLIIPYGTISKFNSEGKQGQVTFDDKYLYLCIDQNMWSRIQIENSYRVKADDGCLVTLYKTGAWSPGVTLVVYFSDDGITIYKLGVQDTTSFYVKNGDKIYFEWDNTGLTTAPWELKYGSTCISGTYGDFDFTDNPITVNCNNLKIFNFQFTKKTTWDSGISLDIYINDVKTGEITASKFIITMKNGDKIRFVWFGCGNAPWELTSDSATIDSGYNGDRTENLLIDEFYASC